MRRTAVGAWGWRGGVAGRLGRRTADAARRMSAGDPGTGAAQPGGPGSGGRLGREPAHSGGPPVAAERTGDADTGGAAGTRGVGGTVGVVVVEQIESRHLAGNLFGDPSRRDVVVYLPPGYGTDGERRYPTAYLLHGFGGRARSWIVGPTLEGGFPRPPIPDVLDEAILRHGAGEMIVVMPDGWSRWGCGQWVDSPLNGNFEKHVTDEVVPFVDTRFRTIPAGAARGVFGSSSGGFGAWHLASRHPDVFGAMALLSADSYFEVTHRPWFYRYYANVFPHEPDGPVAGDVWSWLCYGCASCYSPNPGRPPHFVDLPVAFPTGALVPDVWERWLAFDPVVNWRERVRELRSLRGILLDVGFRDEFDFQFGHRMLSRGLGSAGITHQVEEHDGTHGSRLLERIQFALHWFSRVLDTGAAGQ